MEYKFTLPFCVNVNLNLYIFNHLTAGDKRSPRNLNLQVRCYCTCIACMQPTFVWTSSKNEWNLQNAIRSVFFHWESETRVSTIYHEKLGQCTALE